LSDLDGYFLLDYFAQKERLESGQQLENTLPVCEQEDETLVHKLTKSVVSAIL